jgi:hypothetical protein
MEQKTLDPVLEAARDDRQTGKQANRQTGKQANRQTGKKIISTTNFLRSLFHPRDRRIRQSMKASNTMQF